MQDLLLVKQTDFFDRFVDFKTVESEILAASPDSEISSSTGSSGSAVG